MNTFLHCSCGYATSDADDHTDHYLAAFPAEGDIGTDGRVHAEAARDTPDGTPQYRCLCGYAADDLAELDGHLLLAFGGDDHIGRDGVRHVAVNALAAASGVA